MIPDKTISAINNLVNSLSKEDCLVVEKNNNQIWRYRFHDERQGQYYYNMCFDKVNTSFPELFYETDDKLSEDIYTDLLFKIINKLEK